MGLLDGNIDYGILGAASGLLTPISQGGGFGAAAHGLIEGRKAMDDRLFKQKQMEMLDAYRKAQMEEMAAQTDERKAKAAQMKAQQDALGGLIPSQGAQIPPGFDMRAPGASQQSFNRPQIDPMAVRRALAAGVPKDRVEDILQAESLGMPEVARTIDRVDNGVKYTDQYDKHGRLVGSVRSQVEGKEFSDGATKGFRNPYTGAEIGQAVPIQVSPDTRFTGGITMRGQNMVDARARENLAQQREQAALVTPHYVQDDHGNYVALPGKIAPGAPVIGTPAMMRDNATPPREDPSANVPPTMSISVNGVGRAPTAAEASGLVPVQGKRPNPPQHVTEGLTHNYAQLGMMDDALDALKTTAGKNAVGLKGYLWQDLLNRMDPEGVELRATLADIGSAKIKDRTGATMTIAEQPRLLPFIPLPTDRADVAVDKIMRLRQQIEGETKLLGAFYPKEMETAGKASQAVRAERAAARQTGKSRASPKVFGSEAEAMKAPKGTWVSVNGRVGVVE